VKRTRSKIFQPYGFVQVLPLVAPPLAAQLQPPPLTFPANKKKKNVFFYLLLLFFYFYPCFCFPTSMFKHIEFEGDVNVYVGLVPHW
jgi:hypothetical protein